jgi:type IV secretory pathway VirD2 relaxase
MEVQSISQIFRAGKLKRDMFGADVFRPGKPLNIARSLNADHLEGRRDGRAKASGGTTRAGFGKKLHSLIGPSRGVARRTSSQGESKGFDTRQRAIVKIHYFSHGGGGGAALRAHARYVARDATARDRAAAAVTDTGASEHDAQERSRAHGRYLTRGDQAKTVFYDAKADGVDGAQRAADWAKTDRRHFRLILAPENGSKLRDLKSYTREVMRRAEVAMATRLEWVAVDHWDTDNAHTHIILRGVRDDGRDLIIPRVFVQHGFRSAARDVATERLGKRTPADEREALHREVRAHRPTQLDRLLAVHIPQDGKVAIADITFLYTPAELNDALKARARELQRLGLATEAERNVLVFKSDWQERLKAMELHLDIRKSLIRTRAAEIARGAARGVSVSSMLRGGRDGPGR